MYVLIASIYVRTVYYIVCILYIHMYVRTYVYVSLSKPLLQCIWKLTRKLNTSLSEINVDQLLLDAHHFFVGYVKLTATSKPTDDKAYKTVKTVLFQLVTLLGTKVRTYGVCTL